MASFLEQARAGAVGAEDVDAFVERWHQGAGEGSLRAYLGLSTEQYSRWVREPSALTEIIGESATAPRRAAG